VHRISMTWAEIKSLNSLDELTIKNLYMNEVVQEPKISHNSNSCKFIEQI
jgi:hypothetical protein